MLLRLNLLFSRQSSKGRQWPIRQLSEIINERTNSPQRMHPGEGGETRGAREERKNGGMNTEPIDLALDTKGLTSNAARKSISTVLLAIPDASFQRKRFEFRDIRSFVLLPSSLWCQCGLHQGERDQNPSPLGYLPPELATWHA